MSDFVTIPVGKGRFAMVDAADVEKVAAYRWSIRADGYATAFVRGTGQRGHGRFVRMHRIVSDADEGTVVDHINHDTLDNRRSNLRVVSQRENMMNRAKQKNAGAKGRFRGVHPHRPSTFIAMYRGRYLGTARGQEGEVALARLYDLAALRDIGLSAQLNFPIKGAP